MFTVERSSKKEHSRFSRPNVRKLTVCILRLLVPFLFLLRFYSVSNELNETKAEIQELRQGHIVNLPTTVSRKPLFLSYSQLYEDLILFGVFRNITNGYYIDVGANDPIFDSVTKVFYEMGWHGLNIDPLPMACESLAKDRPRDINLCVGAGDKKAKMTLYERLGLSTLQKEEYRRWHRMVKKHVVDVIPLATICARHCSPDQTIHFLKVDVEGFEKQVLLGADFERYRPLVVVVESTKPRTNLPTEHEWEYILTRNGYEFALQHEINRFYYDSRKPELKLLFQTYDQLLNDFIVAKYLTVH